MNAQERIREARKLERKMGLTVMEQGKDTTTGEDVFVPKFSVGMPYGVSTKEAMSTLALTGLAVFGAVQFKRNLAKAELTTKPKLRTKRKRRAMYAGAASVAAVGLLLPMKVDAQKFQFLNPSRLMNIV